ncbi:unnamed protein product [Bursaphelenchus okinawaensis]|uniref:Major facilitator superfamily (MFS) profile domain-containing protein n=1 Tax=Bursaphelenchus okinawaensis TaxID=465554 RepID=A0A811LT15_9BILA|nr:unnamed protein product [Bursaphelenchus okinawaensis]CAG9127790.1 unnamed protein product [Bursaphelenchus okinawaensis]
MLEDNTELGYKGTFTWSTMEQSFLVSALFYTTLVTIPVSGTLADKFNAKYIIVGSIIIYTILTIAAPTLAGLNYYAFLGGRLGMGFVDGMIFPSITSIVAKWFPPSERSTAAAVYTVGAQIAVVLNSLVAPELCLIDLWNGWPLIFYGGGLVSIIATILIIVFLANSPSECTWIGEKERRYLNQKLNVETSIGKMVKKPRIPYYKILTSAVVWAIALNDMSYSFSYVMFSQFLPSYLRDVLHINLAQNGILTALPFIVIVCVKIPMASFADYLKHRGILTVTQSCKIMQAYAAIGTAGTFLCLALFVDCTRVTLAIVLFISFGLFFSGQVAGAYTAILFVAPPFVGTISSVATFVGMIASIMAPSVFSWLNVNNTEEEYRNVFLFTAAVNLICGSSFVIFGSAEVQPWAKVQKIEVEPHQLENEHLEKY